MPHICVRESVQHWFSYWLVAYLAPSHYLNQPMLGSCQLDSWQQISVKFESEFFIQENAFEIVVCQNGSHSIQGEMSKTCPCYPWEPFLESFLQIMISSNENIFRVTGPLCGEFTGYQWILHTKASDVELWCFLWSAPEPTVEQTMEMPMIWEAIVLIMMSL